MAESVTNEALSGICNSLFELAHYAIDLGRYHIKSGRETSLKEILRGVKKHPNPKYIEELREIDEIGRKAQEHNASHHG